jgi:Na+-translocating ferredoxin:NAD+ oxidoreductase RnfD subunit
VCGVFHTFNPRLELFILLQLAYRTKATDYKSAHPGISSDNVYDAYDKFFSSLVSISQVAAGFTWRNYLVDSYHQGIIHDIVSLQKESIVKDSCSEKLFGMLHEISDEL